MSVEIIKITDSLDSAWDKAANKLVSVLREQPASQDLVIGLCGGRSVVGLLRALKGVLAAQSGELLRRIHFFMVDERIAPLDSADSNFGALKRDLFNELIADGFLLESQLHPFVATQVDAQDACSRYYEELSTFGGEFSVVVLGMGEDGHVAGLFPHHLALTREVKGFSCFFDSPKAPKERMTATRGLIEGAALGFLLVIGEGKRGAWANFNDPEISIESCPAKFVTGIGNCCILTDL